jgi:hypothetical protein
MRHPTEVVMLLREAAAFEARGETMALDAHDGPFSLGAIEYAESHRLIWRSRANWMDDLDAIGLRNRGREAVGVAPVPTMWQKLQALFWPHKPEVL